MSFASNPSVSFLLQTVPSPQPNEMLVKIYAAQSTARGVFGIYVEDKITLRNPHFPEIALFILANTLRTDGQVGVHQRTHMNTLSYHQILMAKNYRPALDHGFRVYAFSIFQFTDGRASHILPEHHHGEAHRVQDGPHDYIMCA